MRWPWTRRTQVEDAASVEDASRHAEQAVGRWPEVYRVTAELSRHRRDNHFGERMRRALEGSDDPRTG